MSRRVAGPYRQHDLLLGRRQRPQPVRESVHLRSPSFRVFLLHLSLLFHYTGFCRKRQEAEIPMKSGYFSLFLQLSLFLSLLGVHLCALCLHRGFSGSIFVQRCSCFRARKTGILRLRK